MAETIGTYYFQLAPSTEGISKSINEAMSGAGEGASKSFGSTFAKALGTGGAIVGGIATAVGGITTAFASGVADVASYGDEIDKMSQKMGISATAYQEWDAVMQHSGTSMESLKASMKTMANAAQSGNEAFQALGISEEQVATMSQEDLFSAVITGLQGMEEGTERTYLASQLLGRGATELGALLNTSAADTQQMKDRVHELNGVLTDEAVKSAAAFQDQLQDMQAASQGLVRSMTSEFLPSFTEVMAGLTDIFAGDTETGAEKIANGIKETLEKVTSKLDTVMEIGSTIVLTLANSIVQNLPSVIKTGMSVLEKLLLGVASMLPEVVQMASSIIIEIANGLSEAAPILIPALVTAVVSAVTALIDNLPLILSAILNLVTVLVDSILNDGLPILLAALPDIISGVIGFIVDSTAQLISAVALILQSIAEALPTLINTLIPVIPELVLETIEALISCGPQLGIAFLELLSVLVTIIPEVIGMIWKEIPKVGMAIIDVFKSKIPELIQTGQNSALEFLGGFSSSKVFSRIGEVFKSIWEGFKANFEVMKENTVNWGKNIIQGLIDGLKSMVKAVGDTVKNIASKVADGFKDFFGIHSPSTLFASYGQYIDEGLAEGIEGGTKDVSKAMGTLNNSVVADASIVYDTQYRTSRVATPNDNAIYTLLAEFLPYLAQKDRVEVNVNGNMPGIFDAMVQLNEEYKTRNGGESAYA